MEVNLDRQALIHLIKGSHVSYEMTNDIAVKRLGSYNATHEWEWDWWEGAYNLYNENNLYDIYKRLQTNKPIYSR